MKYINVQCVYGNSNIEHINKCLLPNLKKSYKGNIKFLALNYESNENYVEDPQIEGLKVININHSGHLRRGFAENHNFIFNKCDKEEFFILMNPDCIPQQSSIDALLRLKLKSPKAAIIEGRQWPFEHPKEYDPLSHETLWSSGAFELIDSDFYQKIHGMDELYFLYDEDVDLSWQAWLNGYQVLYEPLAQIIHFTDGYFARDDVVSNETYFSLRNFILISRKYFGIEGKNRALELLRANINSELYYSIVCDYEKNIEHYVDDKYQNQKDPHLKILGINLFANHRW